MEKKKRFALWISKREATSMKYLRDSECGFVFKRLCEVAYSEDPEDGFDFDDDVLSTGAYAVFVSLGERILESRERFEASS